MADQNGHDDVNPGETNALARCIYIENDGELEPDRVDIFVPDPDEPNGPWIHLVQIGDPPDTGIEDTRRRVVLVLFNEHPPPFYAETLQLSVEWMWFLRRWDWYNIRDDPRRVLPGEAQPDPEHPSTMETIKGRAQSVRSEMIELAAGTRDITSFHEYVVEEDEPNPSSMTIPTDPPETYRLWYLGGTFTVPYWHQDSGENERRYQQAVQEMEEARRQAEEDANRQT